MMSKKGIGWSERYFSKGNILSKNPVAERTKRGHCVARREMRECCEVEVGEVGQSPSMQSPQVIMRSLNFQVRSSG